MLQVFLIIRMHKQGSDRFHGASHAKIRGSSAHESLGSSGVLLNVFMTSCLQPVIRTRRRLLHKWSPALLASRMRGCARLALFLTQASPISGSTMYCVLCFTPGCRAEASAALTTQSRTQAAVLLEICSKTVLLCVPVNECVFSCIGGMR